MNHQGNAFIKSIAFATGKIAFLGYKDDWTQEGNFSDDPLAMRLAIVISDNNPCFQTASAWALLFPMTCGFFLLIEGTVTVYVYFDDEEFPLESGLKEVLRVLVAHGLLTRHQELAAYVAFEIPYSEE